MAYHKLTLIGKLVGDPTSYDFAGGRLAKFGLPVNFTRRKKNPQTGEWEGESFIINVTVFNRENYKLADIVMQSLKKGSQVYVEGRLRMNEYTDKNNVKQSRPELTADVLEFLDGRADGGMGSFAGEGMSRAPRPAVAATTASSYQPDNFDDGHGPSPASPARLGGGGEGETEDQIPF
jgi:single-strand DNA-binding protein